MTVASVKNIIIACYECNCAKKHTGYLQRVRKDDKLDITLNSSSLSDVEVLANAVYERLLKENGKLNFSDKSKPEVIYKEFQVSKKAFRRAVGLLYKERKILITPEEITLVD